MEYDIADTIANFVHDADANFDQRMEEQAQALRRTGCVDPVYGRWVEIGVELLFSAFELEDRDFAVRFPACAHLTKPARREFLDRMEDHLRRCRHCALKHEFELDLNTRIEKSFRENRSALLQQLRARTEDLPEDDHTKTPA